MYLCISQLFWNSESTVILMLSILMERAKTLHMQGVIYVVVTNKAN